jgi:hypothetical protein
MAGRLLHHLLEFFREERGIAGVPNNKNLAPMIHGSPNQVTQLLNGEPTGSHDWLGRVDRALPQLFDAVVNANPGENPEAHLTDLLEIQRRVQRFFFHVDATPGAVRFPQFFAPERRFSTNPHSYRELCQEIDWYSRQPLVGGFRTELTLVLGQQPFPPFDPRRRIEPTLAKAIASDVAVRFLIPIPSARAREFIATFRSTHPECGRPNFSVIGPEAESISRPEVALPWATRLFLRSIPAGAEPNDDSVERVVYSLRHSTPEHPLDNHDLVAQAGSSAELASFSGWHDDILDGRLKSSAAMPASAQTTAT